MLGHGPDSVGYLGGDTPVAGAGSIAA